MMERCFRMMPIYKIMEVTRPDKPGSFYPHNRAEWRKWLGKNHNLEKNVWLVLPSHTGNIPGVSYNDAVGKAVCFGWIDSRPGKRDEQSHFLLFSRRNPKSSWSRLNRERAEKMIGEGLMTEEGLNSIAVAKRNGAWNALDPVQNLIIPGDLQTAPDSNEVALLNFSSFPPSSRRIILEWIQKAKRPETREKRIQETVRLAAEGIRAHHYRQ